jgi:hypothetical protein
VSGAKRASKAAPGERTDKPVSGQHTPPAGARKPGTQRARAAGTPEREARARRTAPPPPPLDAGGWRSGLGTLLRGSGGVLGQISGIDGPARSLDRLAIAAERAGAMLDRIDGELGLERLVEALDNLQRLTVAAEELRDLASDMRRGIREIEERVVDLHERISPPLDRLPMTRRRGARRSAEEAGRG